MTKKILSEQLTFKEIERFELRRMAVLIREATERLAKLKESMK